MEKKYGFEKIAAGDFAVWISNTKVARTVLYIQQHHTYIPNYSNFSGNNHFEIQRSMQTFHIQGNGWADIGQHFSIFPDGSILTGRSLELSPAGIFGRNGNAICIENIRNFDLGGDFMTKEQADAIIMVTASLCDKFDIPVNTDRIVYHHWYNLVTGERNNGTYLNKSCPGTNFFGGNKVENCNVNFIPKVKSAIKPKTSHHFSTEIKFYAQVTAGALNIRSGPGSSNPLISERDPARHGAILRVYEVKKNWYRISSSSQHWVSARYTADVKRAVVNASLLNVRNQPNPEGDVYTQLKKGEVVYVSQESNGWCRIALNDMWVSKEYLKF